MKEETIIYQGQQNEILWGLRFIRHVTWRITAVCLAGIPLLLIFRNTAIILPVILLMIGLIAWKAVHLLLLRRNQEYCITDQRIITRGGFLQRFEHDLYWSDIRSIQTTQTLLQQFLGAGNLILSTAASTGTVSITDVDHIKSLVKKINEIKND